MAEVKVWYDHEGDLLEVIFESVAATMEEVAEDVFERRTPDGRVVGFTIFNFSKHDLQTVHIPLLIRAESSAA